MSYYLIDLLLGYTVISHSSVATIIGIKLAMLRMGSAERNGLALETSGGHCCGGSLQKGGMREGEVGGDVAGGDGPLLPAGPVEAVEGAGGDVVAGI